MDIGKTIPVVVDTGSGFFKAGFAGQIAPSVYYPCVISDTNAFPIGSSKKKAFVGDYAIHNCRSPSEIKYAAAYGVVRDWDAMEVILTHALEQDLQVVPRETTILMTESPFNVPEGREAAAGLLFEQLGCEALYFASDPVLSLYASGRWTGLVIDCGDGTIHITPVYESCVLPHAARMDFGGRDLTAYLCGQFERANRNFSFPIQADVFRLIKEKLCYVPTDFAMELEAASLGKTMSRTYVLPDGQEINLRSELFKCPEIMFKPHLADFDYEGIHEVADRVIANCAENIRPELYQNILLVGGSSEFFGMGSRLEKEMKNSCPDAKVYAHQERKFATWHGGSLLASLSTFQNRWISRLEYDESGPQIFKDRCSLSTGSFLPLRNE